MANAPSYEFSENYQPGFLAQLGTEAFAVAIIIGLVIVAIVGARIMLRRSRRMSPGMRKVLRIIGGLARPAAPVSFRRRRRSRLGSRRKDEPHYKMKPALAAEGGSTLAFQAPPAERVEPAPIPRRRMATALAQLPEEHWPFYDEDELAAVAEVLRSGKVNQWTGEKVFEFERAYTRYLRNGRVIALANGSVALELALKAFGVGPGDEVIVTPRTFVASAFCARLVGAVPVFAEIDRDSGNITPETIEAVLTPRTKAIIPVHIGGWPADMPGIMALARRHGVKVIEDCAQAHGAEIDGLPVGSFGDAATFSFCQDKIITTGGEGGLVTFRDEDAYEWAWSFKDHGKDRRRALEQPSKPGFRWLHDSVGTNWRMLEISAAIGLIQLDKLAQWRLRRVRNAELWAEALEGVQGLRVPRPARNLAGAYYKFYAYVDADPADNEALRDRILEEARSAGLRAFSGSCSEVYREAAFADLGVTPLPVAKELGETSLMFEVHPTLDARRLADRAAAIADIARKVIG